jgi:hypothetical protein
MSKRQACAFSTRPIEVKEKSTAAAMMVLRSIVSSGLKVEAAGNSIFRRSF